MGARATERAPRGPGPLFAEPGWSHDGSRRTVAGARLARRGAGATLSWAGAGRWTPEVALALSAGAAAEMLACRRGLVEGVRAAALALLAADAALGAAEYARFADDVFATPHAALTAAFKSIGLAAATAGVATAATPGGLSTRTRTLAGAGALAMAASLAVSLLPMLLLAHLAAAVLQPSQRLGAALAASALAMVTASQLLLIIGDVRLAMLHLGLAAWRSPQPFS